MHAPVATALLALVLLAGVAHAQPRIQVATTARVVASGAGVKKGAACAIAVRLAPRTSGCFRTCTAKVTCGRRVFELAQATCEATGPFGTDTTCRRAFARHAFTAVGSTGSLDLGDGLGFVGEGDDVAILRFAGGRQRLGDPEDKPTGRLTATLAVAAVTGRVPVPARTCKVTLAYHADPSTPDACELPCVATATCGDLRRTRLGTCRVPSPPRRKRPTCAAPSTVLTFRDDREGGELTVGATGKGAAGWLPLILGGRLGLAR